MKRMAGVVCLMIGLATAASFASDEEGKRDERQSTPPLAQRIERSFGSDHFAAGNSLSISVPVAGDLIASGGKLETQADIGGDAVLAGGDVRMDGRVDANLFLIGGQLRVNGKVGRNARVGGGQIEFGPSSEVNGNLSVGGGNVSLKGRVSGYLQAGGGKVLIDGPVGGDVEARAGELILGPNARIGGKLRYASREPLQRDPAAQVQGDVERINIKGGWPVPEDVERGMGRAGSWIWTLGLMVLAGVLVAVLPGFFERMTNTWRSRFPMALLLGFVLMVCLPIGAVLFMATLIGAPLGLITLTAYPILLLLGYVSSGVALGMGVATRLNQPLGQGATGRVATAVLGVLAIGLLARVPFLGGLVMFLALLTGLGALVLQAWRSTRSTAWVAH